jgi:predicted aminopeptidase
MRMLKADLTEALVTCYQDNRAQLGAGTFDRFFDEPINNARFVAMAVYDRLVPAFERLFSEAGGDWKAFHRAAEALAAEPIEVRQTRIALLLADQQIADMRDDQRTDEVQCKTLAHHRVDAEPSRAEYDHVGGGRNG